MVAELVAPEQRGGTRQCGASCCVQNGVARYVKGNGEGRSVQGTQLERAAKPGQVGYDWRWSVAEISTAAFLTADRHLHGLVSSLCKKHRPQMTGNAVVIMREASLCPCGRLGGSVACICPSDNAGWLGRIGRTGAASRGFFTDTLRRHSNLAQLIVQVPCATCASRPAPRDELFRSPRLHKALKVSIPTPHS
jgi:hypothetical protein